MMAKLTRIIAAAFLGLVSFSSAYPALTLPNNMLWNLAQKTTPIADADGDYMSFTTPGAGTSITISFSYYNGPFSGGSCTGSSLGVVGFSGVSIDADHANKTYYLSPSALYSMGGDHGGIAPHMATVQCILEVNNNSSPTAAHTTVCSGSACSNNGDPSMAHITLTAV